MNTPPEKGTFLGSIVEYCSVPETEMPDPTLLLLKGLPHIDELAPQLEHYFKSVCGVSPVFIMVEGNEARVKFEDSQGLYFQCYIIVLYSR